MQPKGVIRGALKKVAAFIRDEGLLARGDKVLVATSGGVDSVALLRCLLDIKMDLTLIVGHIHHGLRGRESDRDERFVRELALRRGLVYCVAHLKPSRGNIQEEARLLRQHQLAQWARKEQALVATAHHADDQVETVILRLIRGTGTSGLKGIEPVRKIDGVRFIRPFLVVTREEILRYARTRRLKWVEDSTNKKADYDRNRVRHDLMPLLEDLRPGIGRRWARFQKVIWMEEDFWEEATRSALDPMIQRDGRVSLSLYVQLHPALRLRILREVIRRSRGDLKTLGYDHLHRLDRLLVSGPPRASYDLPGLKVLKNYVTFSCRL